MNILESTKIDMITAMKDVFGDVTVSPGSFEIYGTPDGGSPNTLIASNSVEDLSTPAPGSAYLNINPESGETSFDMLITWGGGVIDDIATPTDFKVKNNAGDEIITGTIGIDQSDDITFSTDQWVYGKQVIVSNLRYNLL